MAKHRITAKQTPAAHGKTRAVRAATEHVKVASCPKSIHRDSETGRSTLPSKDPKTGSYTTKKSTKTLKRGAETFASALKRLAEK